MKCMIANDKYIATAKGLQINIHDYSDRTVLIIPEVVKVSDNDEISEVVFSADLKYLAITTLSSKRLLIYSIPLLEHVRTFELPRTANKIRFLNDDTHILVADKSGDVLCYDLQKESSGTKLLGHLSLLLDVLHTYDGKHIITCDRDEKIKVSCYPNTYNIQTYCLGHKEFVNHLEILPHCHKYLTSTSGDGTIKIWDYKEGVLCHTINTNADINDINLKESFVKMMDSDALEVDSLPILHFAISSINENTSIITVAVYSCNIILIYCVHTDSNGISHTLEDKLTLEYFPTAINLFDNTLFVYNQEHGDVRIYKVQYNNGRISTQSIREIKMFDKEVSNIETSANLFESIKVLYKRKFDNVQEYQERKKLRLEKCGQ